MYTQLAKIVRSYYDGVSSDIEINGYSVELVGQDGDAKTFIIVDNDGKELCEIVIDDSYDIEHIEYIIRCNTDSESRLFKSIDKLMK